MNKHEHNWEWIQIQAATDSQDGVEAMCCIECGQQRETEIFHYPFLPDMICLCWKKPTGTEYCI